MSQSKLFPAFLWSRYSKKLHRKIEKPHCIGFFTKEAAEARQMRLAEGREGRVQDGNAVAFYWLVDPDDGIIVDARFQAYGQSALIGAAEIACELVIGKNYDQAKRISADLIDKQVRDRADEPAFPREMAPHLNLILDAIENAAEQCLDIPFDDAYVRTPIPTDLGDVVEGGYPGWQELTVKQKMTVIEEVIARDIRPYIELDEGGVEVVNLINEREVIIAYKGSCTSCFSATGTTLSYIQQTLKAKVHPDLIVIPDLTSLHGQ